MLEILYQDKYIVAINKPHGLLVHRSPIAADAEEFAVQKLRDQLNRTVFPIHRLDRKTSGVLLFAFDSETTALFQAELQKEETQKRYIAMVRGFFPDEIILNHPLFNDKGKEQEAETHFRCLEQKEVDVPFGKHASSRYSLIEALPKTGRMHQIRKHLNHLRHPIIGDRPHGCNKQNRLFLEKWNMKTMLLHAESLCLEHPIYKKALCIEAPFHSEFIRMKAEFNFSAK